MNRQYFLMAAVLATACGSRGSASRQSSPQRTTKQDCYSTIRISSSLPPRNSEGVGDVVSLDEHARLLIDSSDPEDETGSAFVWDAGPEALTTPIGFEEIRAFGMNGDGLVAGLATGSSPSKTRAFVWMKGVPSEILTPGAGAEAVVVNALGHVAGTFATSDTLFTCCDAHRVFLFRGGTVVDLGPGDAADMNDSDQIVGVRDGRVILWSGASVVDLGVTAVADVRFSEFYFVNAKGQVAGTLTTKSGEQRAFVWTAGSLRDLGKLTVNGFNARGDVVGDADGHGVLWRDGLRVDLGTLPGGTFSSALDVNESRQVVGYSWTGSETHPYVWEDGVMTRLEPDTTLFPDCAAFPPYCSEVLAQKVNDRGDIAGKFYIGDGAGRPFLLLNHCPPPPPPSETPDAGAEDGAPPSPQQPPEEPPE